MKRMKPEWKSFLIDNGAEYASEDEIEVQSYGNAERERRMTLSGTVLCDLSHLGMIEAYGEDAQTFLQGQTTNNIIHLNGSRSQLNALCNPKGRMLASFRAFKRGNTYYFVLSQDLLEDTLKRLQMYVMMSKITLEDGSESLVHFGLSGPQADDELKAALNACPDLMDQIIEKDGISILRTASPFPRFELYGELEPMQRLWEKLNVRCAPVGAESWRLLDILAGVPMIVQATKEAFIPQMVNFQLINGVSFHKGCYTGQEIVARTHYLGKQKRRLYRLQFKNGEQPSPADKLYSSSDDKGEPVGIIVSAAPHPDGGFSALAVLKIEFAEKDSGIFLEGNKNTLAEVHIPPYGFPVKPKEEDES